MFNVEKKNIGRENFSFRIISGIFEREIVKRDTKNNIFVVLGRTFYKIVFSFCCVKCLEKRILFSCVISSTRPRRWDKNRPIRHAFVCMCLCCVA